MGWLDVRDDRKRQHLQMIATGNIRDIDRIQQRERRRRWFIFIDIVAILSAIIGYLSYQASFYITSCWFFGITLIIILYLIFRKFSRKRRNNNFRHRRNRKFRRHR